MACVYEELWVCTDCAHYLANGLPDEHEAGWSPELIQAHWPHHDLVNGDCDKDEEFSWSSCDACGSRLGGTRFHCAALEA